MRKITYLILLACSIAIAQRGIPPKEVVTVTHTTKFAGHLDFHPEMVKLLKVPDGWEVSIAASGLGRPRMMWLSPDGRLYITRRDAGDVLMLTDRDGDHKFEDVKTVVYPFKGVHGIAEKDGMLYICNSTELRRYKISSDGSLTEKEMLFKDMPTAGQHPNRTMGFGPDGMLYISIGSACNDCPESDHEKTTIVQVDPKTWKRTIYASGLRNTIGFDWHPQTGELWGIDNGGDAKGDDWPPEELNRIVEGKHYGFPYAYGKKVVDESREDPPGNSKEELVKMTAPSIIDFQAHMAPIDFKFLKGSRWAGDALVCWHGSWNRSKPVGFKVERVHFENGQAKSGEDFLTGFLKGSTRFGRPAGLAMSPDGAVFISDDANGVLYCVKPKS
jgi:glucose/arabinose dehydrogenase